MGRRLRKKALLSEIQRERSALDDTLALLSLRQLTKPGVYVVDFIGGGKSSRALIRDSRRRWFLASPAQSTPITVTA